MTDYQSIKERAESVIVPVVEALGYRVVEIPFGCVGKTDTLTVYIYKKGGVDLDDCVRVNDALDAPLESADVTAGRAYTLNISSPGLDRPIVTDRDFERNEGEKVEAVYVKPVGKKKQVVGILLGQDGDNVYLEVKTCRTPVPKANIKVLRPYIDMKGLK